MAQAETDLLRAEYEAMSRRDWDAFLATSHPDFELRPPALDPVAGVQHGRDATRRAFQAFFEPFDEISVEPERFFEAGDRVVVYFVQRSRPRGSNAVVVVRAAHVWTMRAGRPIRLEIFPRREAALEAAGVS